MSENLSKVLNEAIDDEYKSRATYKAVIKKFGEIRPFINIVEAEGRHVNALLPLFIKYDIPIPKDNWDGRVNVPDTISEACHLGVVDEINNAEMYERLLNLTVQYPDVQEVLKRLQRASKENHLPAFQRCTEKGMGKGKNRNGLGQRKCKQGIR
ncbi:ferritin-like domain-containing protein [Thalassotalea piscium]